MFYTYFEIPKIAAIHYALHFAFYLLTKSYMKNRYFLCVVCKTNGKSHANFFTRHFLSFYTGHKISTFYEACARKMLRYFSKLLFEKNTSCCQTLDHFLCSIDQYKATASPRIFCRHVETSKPHQLPESHHKYA